MPEENVLEKARKDKAEGKSASTQAGEFVREEMHHIREGKHGATSPQQAIAIGLSRTRSRATSGALKRQGRSAASRSNLSRHARSVARRRGSRSRHQSARKAAHTRKAEGRTTRRGSK